MCALVSFVFKKLQIIYGILQIDEADGSDAELDEENAEICSITEGTKRANFVHVRHKCLHIYCYQIKIGLHIPKYFSLGNGRG